MRPKRHRAIPIAAFASITSVIAVLAIAPMVDAEITIKSNPFVTKQADSAATNARSNSQQPPRPTRIAPPANGLIPSSNEKLRPIRIAPPLNEQLAQPTKDSTEPNTAGQLPDLWLADTSGGIHHELDLPEHWLPASPNAAQELPEQWLGESIDAAELGSAAELREAAPRVNPLAQVVGDTLPPQKAETAKPGKTESDAKPEPKPETSPRMDWWNTGVDQSLLERPKWVKFDLETVLLDTLQNSPRIKAVSRRSSVTAERITQQDAAFDPTILFEATGGQSSDPVGNTLTTGGADRLQEKSYSVSAGVQRTGRHGTIVSLSQELGLLDSNSTFFDPENQGNARLSLSLTQPLLARGDQFYNERLLTQARIDNQVAWQDMRGAVERRIAEVISAYWQLYELRCHLMQQRQLLERARYIEQVVSGRAGFDSGRIELAKAQQRVARRYDQLVELGAELKKQQSRLATLIGSDALYSAESQLEMIPLGKPDSPDFEWDLRDAVLRGLENRPEIKAAAQELESAALAVQVTRAELVPQLNAVIDGYLAALNGDFKTGQSYVDQFSEGSPGFSGAIQFEMPRGRRAARSAHREAHHRYHQKTEELREAIQRTRWEIETALIDVRRASAQKRSKQHLLVTATEEETVLTRRWELMAADGGRVGVVLENLLDAQQRRTDAEREWVTTQSDYLISLIELQRAMGTLLITEAISPIRTRRDCAIEFVRGQPTIQRDQLQSDQIDSALPVQSQGDVYGQFLNNLQQDSIVAPQILEK